MPTVATLSQADQWLVWTLAASLFGLAGAFFSVSLFGPPTTTNYMLVAFAGAMPAFIIEGYSTPRRVLIAPPR
jgi:hypothetical protein